MPDIHTVQKSSPLKLKPHIEAITNEPCIEVIRTSSVSNRCRPVSIKDEKKCAILRQTNIFFSADSHPDATPYYFSPIPTRVLSLPQKLSKIKYRPLKIPELIIKGGKKTDRDNTLDKAMQTYLLRFYNAVELKFNLVYNQIDMNNKGWVDYDDLVNYFIMKDIENRDKDYEHIKLLAKELYSALMVVSYRSKVLRKHFLALCGVFEYNKGDSLDFSDRLVVSTLREQIIELKELFKCYTDNKIINLKSILCEINFKDKISKSRVFVDSNKIDFARFLRCLPFFIWVYNHINTD